MSSAPSSVGSMLYRSILRACREYAAQGVPLAALPTRGLYLPLTAPGARWGLSDEDREVPPALPEALSPPTERGDVAEQRNAAGARGALRLHRQVHEQLRGAFERGDVLDRTGKSDPLDVGFQVLRKLRNRLKLIGEAEEQTLEGLKAWAQLLGDGAWRRHDPLTEAAAVEEGCWLFHRLIHPPASHFILEQDANEAARGIEEDVEKGKRLLDSLAAQIRAARPSAYGADGLLTAARGAASASERTAAYVECLRDLGKVVYKEEGFKPTFSEYMYDGATCVLLPEVLQNRQGVPLALGALLVCLARRLGLPLRGCQPFLTAPEAASTATPGLGPDPLPTHLPPELVQRLHAAARASHAAAGPQSSACWLLLDVGFPQMQHGGGGDDNAVPMYVNPFDFRGAVSEEDCHQHALHAGHAITQQQLRHPASPSQWYASMARLAVQMHTRRGESDDVANWLRQLLALDPDTPEWEDMDA